MSLINKMLQDLDARGSKDGAELPPDIRAAAVSERTLPRKQVIIAASALTVGAAVAAVIWLKLPAPAPASLVVVPAPVVKLAARPPAAADTLTQGAAAVAPAAAPAAAAPQPALQSVQRVADAEPTEPAAAFAAPTPRAVKPGPRTLAGDSEDAPAAPAPRERTVRVVSQAASPAPVLAGREVTVPQRAENAYRQALSALDEGKVTTAYAALEQALRLNPRHDAARQSLVSLLIEDGRNDDAMRQLEQGLAADAGQPALAMLLARMQIERGIPGVPTLQRTLPAAAGNADYHAFLAGALQREQRHREAIDQYAAALRITPNHGVWLMGMGISLQADKRPRDAAEAFSRARASGMLTPALETFVERKLQQLAP